MTHKLYKELSDRLLAYSFQLLFVSYRYFAFKQRKFMIKIFNICTYVTSDGRLLENPDLKYLVTFVLKFFKYFWDYCKTCKQHWYITNRVYSPLSNRKKRRHFMEIFRKFRTDEKNSQILRNYVLPVLLSIITMKAIKIGFCAFLNIFTFELDAELSEGIFIP